MNFSPGYPAVSYVAVFIIFSRFGSVEELWKLLHAHMLDMCFGKLRLTRFQEAQGRLSIKITDGLQKYGWMNSRIFSILSLQVSLLYLIKIMYLYYPWKIPTF